MSAPGLGRVKTIFEARSTPPASRTQPRATLLPKLIGQCRVSPNVYPVVLFGRHMAVEAFKREILGRAMTGIQAFSGYLF